MKRALLIIAALCALCSPRAALAQGGNLGSNSSPVLSNLGRPLPGVNIAVCQPVATTAATVTSDVAVLTMATNPITAGFAPGMTIMVSGFSGSGGVPSFSDAETPSGLINSSNTTFVLANAPSPAASLLLVKNGVVLHAGVDFTLSAATITTTTAPTSGDVLLAWYRYAVAGSVPNFADGQTPSGAVNGSNTVFVLTNAPSPAGSLVFVKNGLIQKAGVDYTLSSATITTTTAPLSGDILLAWYRYGTAGGTSPSFADEQTPSGAINGSNTIFVLANTPLPGASLLLVKNGLIQKVGTDYTLTGATITTNAAPVGGDVLLAWFRYASSGSDSIFNTGSFTNSTGISGGATILSVTSSVITYSLTAANYTAASNGVVLQQGNQLTPCGGLSAVYSDPGLSVPTANPLGSDAYGNWNVFANSSTGGGVYYIQFYGTVVGATRMGIYAVAGAGAGSAPYVSGTSPYAATGVLRLAASDTIGWRNASNTGDLSFSINSGNSLLWNGGSLLLPQVACPTGVASYDLLCADSNANRWGFSNNGGAEDFVVGENTVDVFTNKTFDTGGAGNSFKIAGHAVSATVSNGATLVDNNSTGATLNSAVLPTPTTTSPVINGTPSGTGIPRTVVLSGSQAGNYVTSNAGLVAVDATNLQYTVTIPAGWKLNAAATGYVLIPGGGGNCAIALVDTTSSTVLQGINTTVTTGYSLVGSVNGSGSSHTIQLQYGACASGSITVQNSSAFYFPQMAFTLEPSN